MRKQVKKQKNKLKREMAVNNSTKVVRYITFCNLKKDVANLVCSSSK